MTEIQKSFAPSLYRLLGAPGVGLAGVSEEILPVVVIGSLREAVHAARASGSFGLFRGAVVGEFTTQVLQNFRSSTANLIVTSCRWRGNVGSSAQLFGGRFAIDFNPPGLGAPNRPRPRDLRRIFSTATATQAEVLSGSSALVPPAALQLGLAVMDGQANYQEFCQNGATFILPPDSYLAVYSGSANESSYVNWQWDEEDI